ncbi:MAG: Pycsar system effector family protein [Labilibaculum antarcticum]
MKEKIECAKFTIQRFDNYTAAANVKGNFLLAFNTFLVGGIIANCKKLEDLVSSDWPLTILEIFLIGLIIFGIITTFVVIKAVYPFLTSGNSSKDGYHSHLFFNSIADFDNEVEYHNSFSKQKDENIAEDLNKQVYQLSIGLKHKFELLRCAMRFMYAELVIIGLVLILIIVF